MELGRCCKSFSFIRGVASKSKSHYDSLGVKSNATQGEIKTAYYELSKRFHPDKNHGSEESLHRFRQVTDAYDILGNVKSRKLYDRGLVVGGSGTVLREDVPDDTDTKFYRQREKRSAVPQPTDRDTVYDFDAWSKAHYTKNAERRYSSRKSYENRQAIELEKKRKIQTLKAVTIVFFSIFILTTLSQNVFSSDYDEVTIKNRKIKADDVT